MSEENLNLLRDLVQKAMAEGCFEAIQVELEDSMKNCPFCAKQPKIYYNKLGKFWFIECYGCGYAGFVSYESPWNCMDKWNERLNKA
jgi:hypothetical protein